MSIGSFIKKIGSFFTSGKAQRALAEVDKLLPLVVPIIKAIGQASGNRTVAEVTSAFDLYGVPWVHEFSTKPPETAMRHLAQVVVERSVPASAQSVVNAAIELAVVASK